MCKGISIQLQSSAPAYWLRVLLCLALVLAGGLHAANASLVAAPDYSSCVAAAVDGDADPCTPSGDHALHPGCVSGVACAFLIAPSEALKSTVAGGTAMQSAVVTPLAGGEVTPLFHPPKLPIAA